MWRKLYEYKGIEIMEVFSDGTDIKDFPKISVLRHNCYWLVQNIFHEQADLISQDDAIDFNHINWALKAIYIYKEKDLTNAEIKTQQNEDCLEYHNGFVESLNESYSYIFEEVIAKTNFITKPFMNIQIKYDYKRK